MDNLVPGLRARSMTAYFCFQRRPSGLVPVIYYDDRPDTKLERYHEVIKETITEIPPELEGKGLYEVTAWASPQWLRVYRKPFLSPPSEFL